MTIYLSNRLETLAEHLTANLFTSSTLFSKKLLVLPNFSLKEWISFYIADQLPEKIAMGYIPVYLNQAIEILTRETGKQLSPLGKILEIKEKLGERYSFSHCQTLASLFEIYGTYGGNSLARWENDPQNEQEHVWKSLSTRYTYPYKLLKGWNNVSFQEDISVHIFGFSHFSYLHFSFFDKLAKKIPVSMYHLSPCREFWSDTLSDRDAKRFFKKTALKEDIRLTYEEYLEDRHPLLANLGKVGREFAFLVEESHWQTKELYVDVEPSIQLRGLQHDLLHLKQNNLEFFDSSVQIHISSTKHREIQNLYHTIKAIMSKEQIDPKDVLVMAPDIVEYAPYIQAYFGKEIPYRIADMPITEENKEIHALFILLELEEKRWDVTSILSLFANSLFLKKHHWDESDVILMRKWVLKGEIRWAAHDTHANILLRDKYCDAPFEDATATWQAGLTRLYKSLATFQERFDIDIFESELLGEISYLLESLYDDLRMLYDHSKLSMSEWIEYLKCLYTTYFAYDDESLLIKLNTLKEQSKAYTFAYTFTEIIPLLKSFLGQEKVTLHRHKHQAITFSSLFPMRAYPAQVIALIGMQYDAFPRKDSASSFNLLLKEKEKDYFPSRMDLDRYVFLEAILSARKYFLLSYLGKSPHDQTLLPESSVIAELQRFLRPKNIIVHPDVPFDPQYFLNNHSFLKNSSKHHYEASLALMQTEKKKHAFFSFSQKLPSQISPGEHIIDISQLRRICRTPISCYLENNFEISFNKDKLQKEKEEFFLSGLHLGQARKMLGVMPFNDVAQSLSYKGALPSGAFRKVALFRLLQDEELIRPFPLTTIHFSLSETNVYFDKKEGWKSPPLKLHYDEWRSILFVGTIHGVCEEGLFAFEKAQFASAIKFWSDFLILNHAGIVDASKIIFGKEKKKKNRFFSQAEPHLKALVDYYFYAQKTPSLLLPDWVEPILGGKWDKLQSLFEKETSYDEGAFWMLRNLNLEEINRDELQKYGSSLYQEMKDAWF